MLADGKLLEYVLTLVVGSMGIGHAFIRVRTWRNGGSGSQLRESIRTAMREVTEPQTEILREIRDEQKETNKVLIRVVTYQELRLEFEKGSKGDSGGS